MLNPSKRLAYILGVLCSDGYVSKNHRRVSLSVKDKSFAKKFKSFFTDEFKVEGKMSYIRLKKKEHSNIYTVNFYCTKVIKNIVYNNYRFQGNDWHILIEKKYKWVLKDKYFYNFLSGFFDGDGSIDNPDNNYRLRLHIGYNIPAHWLQNMLEKKGFKFKIEYRYDRNTSNIVKELALHDIASIVKFSKKIKSSIHRKEIRLIRYRNAIFICPKYCENIEESFNIVKHHRLKTGFGSLKLMKIDEIAKLNIPQSTIRNWIRKDKVPMLKYNSRNNKIYWKI